LLACLQILAVPSFGDASSSCYILEADLGIAQGMGEDGVVVELAADIF
jgi:hypothetical protein